MAWEVGHRIQRDGTSQPQRLLKALLPENSPIDARREEDLLYFLYQMADQFAYYNHRNEWEGQWQEFFSEFGIQQGESKEESLAKIRTYLQKARQRHDNSVFMTILLTFLKLFRHLQNDINQLTQKHLEFYYEKVLDFRRLPPKPDEVHVLFELAPHLKQHRLPAGTALRAGKDALGRPLTYVTNREIVVNQAKLGAIKTVLVNDDGIYAAEVANSADGLGAPLEGNPPMWPTFGDPMHMQRSTVGFAIASPLLWLAEGERKITLTLSLANAGDADQSHFEKIIAHASGAEEWLELEIDNVDKTDNQVTFSFTTDPGTPAIVGYDAKKLGGQLATHFPVVRLLLNPHYPPYEVLKEVNIKEVNLTVSVGLNKDDSQIGVRNLIVQNDYARQDPNSAFQPFGATPAKGSHFYIGSREAFCKPLSNLKVYMQWTGLPEDDQDFVDYYGTEYNDNKEPPEWHYHYPQKYRSKGAYTFLAEFLSEGKWESLNLKDNSLFDDTNGLDPKRMLETGPLDVTLKPDLPDLEMYTQDVQQGFIRLELQQDFGHRLYPKIFAETASKTELTDKTFPNTPYTPTIQSISLGYEATQNLAIGAGTTLSQFFHILPFGCEEQKEAEDLNLLPHLPHGALYLGLEDLEPPKNLNLLFQIAEGSGEPTNTIQTHNIEWNYLTTEGWRSKPLTDQEILIDTTQALQKSGIIAFNIGKDAGTLSTLLPEGYHWLAARLKGSPEEQPIINPKGAARTIAIHTQAITAIFEDQNNDPNHLQAPLAAGSITKLQKRERAIRGVQQPYASFGGSMLEKNPSFYARASERLRHKQRAITLWDIERLILQRFPQLYEVKVIPHAGLDEEEDGGITYHHYSEFCPGQLTVVVISKLRNQTVVNPLQPLASNALREEVRRFLLPLTAHIIGQETDNLHVINPRYEEIQVSCGVGFREGYDGGFYAVALNNALQHYLSPWAFKEGPDIQFGNQIYSSQLLAFIEEQPYVDYVTDFEMRQGNAGPGIEEMGLEIDFVIRDNGFGMLVDVAEASCSASILVSKDKHLIKSLQTDEPFCKESN